MGGNARVPGNVTPAAEFNFWFDPEAAAAVLAAPIPRVVMFGLDITNHAPLHKTRFDRIVAVDTPLTRLMRHDMGPRFERDPAATWYVWDCITAAWLVDPSIVTASEPLPIRVDTTFGPNYGATVVDRRRRRRATGASKVMLDLDVERFFALYADLLARPVAPVRRSRGLNRLLCLPQRRFLARPGRCGWRRRAGQERHGAERLGGRSRRLGSDSRAARGGGRLPLLQRLAEASGCRGRAG